MKLIQLFETISLHESAKTRYLQSFATIFALAKRITDIAGKDTYVPTAIPISVEDKITWAVKVLKKDDRIQWYLRWIKIEAIRSLLESVKHAVKQYPELEPITEELKKIRDKIVKQMGIKQATPPDVANTAAEISSGQVQNSFEHYLSLGLPEIENTIFGWKKPSEIFSYWQTVEREWANKAKQLIDIDREDVETVIKFEDGSEWINLNEPYCNIEAQAMGHCGNRASYDANDTILSYRTIEKTPKGEMWKPRLTFVLNTKSGMLGEMKGRANNKPDSKYHGVIIELLKHPMIKGIAGGGYAPESNFSLDDLPDEVADNLIESKPSLGTIEHQYKKYGMTEDLITRIKETYKNEVDSHIEPEYNADKKAFMFKVGDTIPDFTEEVGGDTLKYVMSKIEGLDHVEIYIPKESTPFDDLWNDFIPDKEAKEIGEWILKNHADLVEEWKEENDENFSVNNRKVIWHFLDDQYNEDEIEAVHESLWFGYMTAHEVGAMDDMHQALKKWLNNLPNENDFNISLHPGPEVNWEEKQYLAIAESDMMEIMSTHLGDIAYSGLLSFINIRDLDQPYYGWSGYHEESGKEQALNRLHDEGVLS